jgi:hypothetical protein
MSSTPFGIRGMFGLSGTFVVVDWQEKREMRSRRYLGLRAGSPVDLRIERRAKAWRVTGLCLTKKRTIVSGRIELLLGRNSAIFVRGAERGRCSGQTIFFLEEENDHDKG